jgi:hypothetical protein
MTNGTPTCVKCNGRMKLGFIVEVLKSRAYPNTWIEGAPETHYLRGVKLKDRTTLPISTFRCTACGFLESYAHEDSAADVIDVSDLRR